MSTSKHSTDSHEETPPCRPRIGDPLGRALMIHGGFRHERQFPLYIERDDGLIIEIDIGAFLQDEADWAERYRWALSRSTGRVLDIGGGAGQHALALQQRGLSVLVTDTSQGALEVCAVRGIEHTALVSIDETPKALSTYTFETILLLGQNVGLLATPDKAISILRSFRDLATPETRILCDTVEPLAMCAFSKPYVQRNLEAGRYPGQARYRLRWRDLGTEWFDYIYLTYEELKLLADESGWVIADTYHEGAAYCATLELRNEREKSRAGTAATRTRSRQVIS
ncbi:class I SAM-dependent methyltransferase [Nocardia sp. N2S4-5]|uniref:class I SAM-dependent methyltransferase n=1 Tax=Nocardia sp. N2S4-5 TaxID=3351565 RepID=UPI0037D94380